MKERWQMNRIGFVNFWLYDEETFTFSDGKLLLRGQNGSGKSITTQSFIPFILDGDRTPSRLDPFGSSDRKMEYYFLGEEGKDESTGYLFLEFKKESTGQYRTIGIGQRARRGKPMDFWGFVILDGRRIGYDLWLYKEVGSAKLPYDKQELKKILGEGTPFTDMPREYKELVNKHLFGFQRMDQYDQFIRLLVKVRAPKLSKEFKPTKVYEILNESLQTLSDEDLRAMVDAMEKMDSIQGSLEQLNRAYTDARIIRTEYVRYNQFMLAKKAQDYLDSRKAVEQGREKLDAQKQQYGEYRTEQGEKRTRQAAAQQRNSVIEAELEGLHETDLEAAQEKRQKSLDEKEEVRKIVESREAEIEKSRERIRQSDSRLHKVSGELELYRAELEREGEELQEQQETFLFHLHDRVMALAAQEQESDTEKLLAEWKERKKEISAGLTALQELEEANEKYDRAAEALAQSAAEKSECEQAEEQAILIEEASRDDLIEAYYRMAKQCEELQPSAQTLLSLEKLVKDYSGQAEAGELRRLLETVCQEKRKEIRTLLEAQERQENLYREQGRKKQEELRLLQEKQEVEPSRSPLKEETRKRLTEAGIAYQPFYIAVEFALGMTEEEQAVLEAQLQDAGLLDALVVAESDKMRVRSEFPELADVMICTQEDGKSEFNKLVASEELPECLREEMRKILHSIYEEDRGGGLYLGRTGTFRNGILEGHSVGRSAEFVGRLARKRKRERMIAEISEEISAIQSLIEEIQEKKQGFQSRLEILDEEYRGLPSFTRLDQALEGLRQSRWHLEQAEKQYRLEEQREREAFSIKNSRYQKMLQICKGLPYGRTESEYREAADSAEEYGEIWLRMRELTGKLSHCRFVEDEEREKIEREEEAVDGAYEQKRREQGRIEALEAMIRQTEAFLNDPENKEKAEKLRTLKEEQRALREELQELSNHLFHLEEELKRLEKEQEEDEQKLREQIAVETFLRSYFEEELALGLVVKREGKSLEVCAKEARQCLRDSDKGRNPEDLTTSLLKVYQKYNSNLVSYGTALEDCFEESGKLPNATRKRQRIVSVWNGKKLYLEAFCDTLKAAVEETELLIQQKDRELFEDILSRTLSQQLTGRIAESRRWANAMSKLMQEMDTSMGLKFSLSWKPKSAESDQELDTTELEKLLLRDRALLTIEDIEKVALHFRSKIKAEKEKAEEAGGMVNYMDLVRDALDYRRWFEFQMFYCRAGDKNKPLTNAAFNRFSGGEKAMAMYVPLFAAVNAQYQKAEHADCPRIVAMDEAFAGVDDKNISTMFRLVGDLNFDYILNSQALWGCYETVPALRISELYHPIHSSAVTVIHYTWNGHERVLDEQ